MSILFSTGLGAGALARAAVDGRARGRRRAAPGARSARRRAAAAGRSDGRRERASARARSPPSISMPTGAIAPRRAGPGRRRRSPRLPAKSSRRPRRPPSASLAPSPAVEPRRRARREPPCRRRRALSQRRRSGGRRARREDRRRRCSASPRIGRRCAWPPIPTISASPPSPRAHPHWPGGDWIRAVEEAHLYTAARRARRRVAALFAGDPPRTPAGKLAAARAALDAGRRDEATANRARAVARQRSRRLDARARSSKDFAAALTRADHKYRADRLLYAEKSAAGAARGGARRPGRSRARRGAHRGDERPADGAGDRRRARRAAEATPACCSRAFRTRGAPIAPLEAAGWLARAPSDAGALIDPDKWWSEQRMVARQLLDLGRVREGLRDLRRRGAGLGSRAQSTRPSTPAGSRCASSTTRRRRRAASPRRARSPRRRLSIARAAYWQGRAAEAMGRGRRRRDASTSAPPRWPIAYYGQLAAERLGPQRGRLARAGDGRRSATRATRRRASSNCFYAAGLDDLATSLAEAAAGRWRDEAQIAALAEVVAAHADATTNVEFGKIATERGFALDATAFPTFGVPPSRRWRIRPTCRASTRWRGRRANSPGAPPRAPAPRA